MSPTPSCTNSPLDNEDKAEELCLQKKREERARREAESKAEAEEEAAAKARLVKNRQKKEEKKKREAEEKKRRKKEQEQEKEKEKEVERRPICNDSVIYIARKRKHLVMMAAPAGNPDRDDPYPGDDSSKPDSDEEKDDEDLEADPSPLPQKSSKCDCCISRTIPCKMIGQGLASYQACRKAKVKCLFVGNERKIRRSKRTKREESPITSLSNLRIEALEEHNQILNEQSQMLAHRLYVMEDMVRFILQNLLRRQEFEGEESEEDQ
ncbi:hypothetical protein F5050DRAFT_1716068, partial [Lentinula boryana]